MGWHRKRIHILVDVWLHRKRHVNFLGGTAKKKEKQIDEKKNYFIKIPNCKPHSFTHTPRTPIFIVYRTVQKGTAREQTKSLRKRIYMRNMSMNTNVTHINSANEFCMYIKMSHQIKLNTLFKLYANFFIRFVLFYFAR